MVAHECILDLRPITKATGVTVDDVAKRLIDYGFHAPTMSFPVAGTLMVEPTETESKVELDRFCDAMIAIRAEIDRVAAGEWPVERQPAAPRAPHRRGRGHRRVDHPYARDEAAFPVAGAAGPKYFPPVSRIDGGLRRPQPHLQLPTARGCTPSPCLTNGRRHDRAGERVRRATSMVTGVAVLDVGRQEGEGDAVAEHRREVAAGDDARLGRRRRSTGCSARGRTPALGGDAPQAPARRPASRSASRAARPRNVGLVQRDHPAQPGLQRA